MDLIPEVMAWLLEIQACTTLWAGTLAGKPQLNMAWNLDHRIDNVFYSNLIKKICKIPLFFNDSCEYGREVCK